MNQETESLLRQFIPEAQDLLEQAGRSLLALERIPGDASLLNELFRAVHTLKGTSGLFAIEPLTRLVHAAEDLLFAVQAGRMVLAPDLADGLLESLDQVGLWIDSLAEASVLPNDAAAVSERWVFTASRHARQRRRLAECRNRVRLCWRIHPSRLAGWAFLRHSRQRR